MSDLFVDNIKHQSSQGSGTITLGASGETIALASGAEVSGFTGQNYPAFEAYMTTATQSISDGVYAKAQINTKIFDTNSCYDNATNYRFTPTVAGKYFCYGQISLSSGASANWEIGQVEIRKNGGTSDPIRTQLDFRGNSGGFNNMINVSGVRELNGSTDYIELFGRLYHGASSSGTFVGDSGDRITYFGAFRIGA